MRLVVEFWCAIHYPTPFFFEAKQKSEHQVRVKKAFALAEAWGATKDKEYEWATPFYSNVYPQFFILDMELEACADKLS